MTDDNETVSRIELSEVQWQRVSPKLIVVEVAGSVMMALITLAAALAAFFLGFGIPALVLAAFFLMSVISAALVPRRVKAYGYQLREDDLVFRRGLLAQRIVSVPYGRMQLIDITRGPIARLVGLSDLKFVTAAASTGVAIPGLPEAAAVELRDRLVNLAESRRVGL
jgi:membrane protein YdbS with pleckstrin-like domain